MALIIISGIPAAGKSQRAKQLAEYFESRIGINGINEVKIIDDPTLGVQKSDYYDRENEKKARGKQMSAVKRFLKPGSVVILDNMDYIKGFRYQLFCEAKAARVTSCVVYVGTHEDRAREFNASIDEKTRWPNDLFEQLVFRFEEPNGMTRWDSPLFIVTPEDSLPLSDIWDALINKQPHKPNAATAKRPNVEADYLSVLNDTTSQIVREALDLHSLNPGAVVILRGRQVELPYTLTLPQLTRIRRNFVALNRQTAMPLENVEQYFIEFLQQNWDVTS